MAQFAGGAKLFLDYNSLIGGTPSYVEVGEVVDITGPTTSADQLDASIHGDLWRHYLPGLRDGGEISVSIRAEAGNAPQLTMLGSVGAGPFALKIEWPLKVSTNTVPRKVEADVFLANVDVGLPHDGLATMDVVFKITSSPAWAEEAL
jgi:hypothetical protein